MERLCAERRDWDIFVYQPMQSKTMQKEKEEEEEKSNLQTLVSLNCGRPDKQA
jgi:hypothetical protein